VLHPVLGQLPLREIDATAVLSALKAAENDGILESARRARAIAKQVFDYAIATGRASVNPARDLGNALRKPEVAHFAALKADQIGSFLTALDASGMTAVTKAALLLMLYTGLRDGSLRGARWREIDFEAAKWTIPAERMKRREEHAVPLPRQAIALLRELKRVTDRGPDSFIFASSGKAGYLAENTLRIALHRLGFEVTAHGFRSLMTDELYKAGFRSEWVERQMHHQDKNAVRAAYLRTDFYDQRVPMMQWWADTFDALKAGGTAPAMPDNVIPMQRAA
jgi:integrase